jgi:hypothetical protein
VGVVPFFLRLCTGYHACDIHRVISYLSILLPIVLLVGTSEPPRHADGRVRHSSRPSAQKKSSPISAKAAAQLDDYQVPAGTPLMIRLRTAVDSGSARIDDAVRATLLEPVTQDGVELIPKGSTLHGKISEVLPASRQNRTGRLVMGFHVIEHVETRSLATIKARAVPFEATLAPKEKFRDVRVPADQRMILTLASPLKVHIPRAR